MSTHVKIPHCWKSHVAAHMLIVVCVNKIILQLMIHLFFNSCLSHISKALQEAIGITSRQTNSATSLNVMVIKNLTNMTM